MIRERQVSKNMKEYRADLHIHTCLSPCAEPEMTPSAIVRQAVSMGLNVIGICDHNSTENVAAVAAAALPLAVTVIPGIEITSREEVHIVGLFNSQQGLACIQKLIYDNLPGTNDESVFGSQTIVDKRDRKIGTNRRLLIGATDLSVDQVVDAIHACRGLAVAAHVDRQRFSLVGQLGFIPKGLKLDALELSDTAKARRFTGFPLVTSSDAHRLRDIGTRCTSFLTAGARIDEVTKALKGQDGRRALINMEDMSLHILDIVENSLDAGADRVEISIIENTRNDSISLRIHDNGKGMDAHTIKNAMDPFYTSKTTRSVGLGLPLLAQAARQAGGTFDIESRPRQGTTVKATFQLSHPDRQPVGDVPQTLRTILIARPKLTLVFEYWKDSELVAGFGIDPNDDHDKES